MDLGASLAAQQWRIRLQRRNCRRHEFDPWVRKIPWKRAWPPTPVFYPGESHGQRCLVGYSPQGHKELDTTEVTEQAYTSFSRLWALESKASLCVFTKHTVTVGLLLAYSRSPTSIYELNHRPNVLKITGPLFRVTEMETMPDLLSCGKYFTSS